ncbi:hypothetical protein B5S31_g3024 [[Candida] boidinii]|nr:hypothetical protein B5S31_g3024 [[Candida] boidinii]
MTKELKINENELQNQEIPIYASMGMFIIDEIHFPDKTSVHDIFGGGGSFTIVGSRMVLTRKESKKAGWIVDIGSDCPQEILDELERWNTGAVMRYDNSRFCTRGWNMYGDNDFRSFKYLTPKKRIDIPDLIENKHLLLSKSYHLLCSPERCVNLLNQMTILRHNDVPMIVWEPIPDECTPENLDECLAILDKVDVLSPNAAEAAAFFNENEPATIEECERIAFKFAKYTIKNGSKSGVVLRCGKLGCFIVNSDKSFQKWFPAYHNPKYDDFKVVDPTGAGNTFIGAFCTGFILSDRDWDCACICGNIGSGAAIEQIGMPKLTFDNEIDLWNGKSFEQRLNIYLSRNPEIKMNSINVLKRLQRI